MTGNGDTTASPPSWKRLWMFAGVLLAAVGLIVLLLAELYIHVEPWKTVLISVSSTCIAAGVVESMSYALIYSRLADRLERIEKIVEGTVPHANQQAADLVIRRYIEQQAPMAADLLEFSSKSVHTNIIEPLFSKAAGIRLLLQNPLTATERFRRSPKQKGRICGQFADAIPASAQQQPGSRIRIRFYGQIASLRGRNLRCLDMTATKNNLNTVAY